MRFEDSERVGEGGEGARTATQIASDLAVEVLSALCGDPDDTPAPWSTTDTDTTGSTEPDAGATEPGAAGADATDTTDAGTGTTEPAPDAVTPDVDDVNVDAADATADTDSAAPDAGTEDDDARPDADDLGVDVGSRVSGAAGSPDRTDTGADPPGTGDADPSNTASARGAPPPARGLVGDVDRVLSRVRAVVQVTVAATTLAGLDDEPGFLAGYGPIDADTARKLAGNAAGWERVFCHPDTGALLTVERVKWCV
ncbi:hypothetical protein [Microbacterium barkeri]|uniref:hypothetical protein n=1 Tax=Microbacterium barkeri TaxID=33917 RepID=UPI0022F2691F|nr:hypothetical protein [Microbacterium barkeri]